MPELPEVETIRAGLDPHVRGAVIEKVVARRPDLRFALPKELTARLEGQRIVHLGRRAKYLLFELQTGATLLSHLGMTGNYRLEPRLAHGSPGFAPKKHDHLIFELRGAHGAFDLVYSDPRRFGYVDLVDPGGQSVHLAHLGPEPLGNEMNALALASAIAKRRGPIKTVLLDQTVIAGLGNIYVCEALWRAQISPLAIALELVRANGAPTVRLERLTAAIKHVLTDALAAGGSTLRDYRNAEGETGYFQHSFDVYGREGQSCRRQECAGTIVRQMQAGRSSFWCPRCQNH